MKVFLQHPHKNEPAIEVDETAIVPYMVQGYQQVPAPKAQPKAEEKK